MERTLIIEVALIVPDSFNSQREQRLVTLVHAGLDEIKDSVCRHDGARLEVR